MYQELTVFRHVVVLLEMSSTLGSQIFEQSLQKSFA